MLFAVKSYIAQRQCISWSWVMWNEHLSRLSLPVGCWALPVGPICNFLGHKKLCQRISADLYICDFLMWFCPSHFVFVTFAAWNKIAVDLWFRCVITFGYFQMLRPSFHSDEKAVLFFQSSDQQDVFGTLKEPTPGTQWHTIALGMSVCILLHAWFALFFCGNVSYLLRLVSCQHIV